MSPQYSIELLGSKHHRAAFSCGIEALDRYLREQASQDMRRRANSCFVAVDTVTSALAGYYTLSAAGIPCTDLPEHLLKKLPRYPFVPVALLGRLAVDKTFQGKNLGAALLGNAIQRSLRSEVAVAAIVVIAKNEQAESFYRHHDFLLFGNLPRQLILPLSSYRLNT
ncbi:GNAT family N-acetyltransferase [Methylomonas sp. AM2-LC]|uniref:GNAT family N-acetyltransferase n=1 Tax=Methylomonas sp. AM2-LC TaxID=3153301 RepID=UPI003266E98D